jgi:hypothetical protein
MTFFSLQNHNVLEQPEIAPAVLCSIADHSESVTRICIALTRFARHMASFPCCFYQNACAFPGCFVVLRKHKLCPVQSKAHATLKEPQLTRSTRPMGPPAAAHLSVIHSIAPHMPNLARHTPRELSSPPSAPITTVIKGCKFSSTGATTYTWTGPADDQGRPNGFGELTWESSLIATSMPMGGSEVWEAAR